MNASILEEEEKVNWFHYLVHNLEHLRIKALILTLTGNLEYQLMRTMGNHQGDLTWQKPALHVSPWQLSGSTGTRLYCPLF
jgi:hypothetical protein